MDDFEFECPHCSQSLIVDISGAGLTVPCPACAAEIVIPQKELEFDTPAVPQRIDGAAS